ncbi:MAG: LacI family DNA-binding transcriptional regulator [Lentisphaeria bacterium]|nr:LacI family DNA-binding transcriptional regulator [Lentisphaeria bacterium]
MKLPTIRDIAAEAGVNTCVVSHVLHNDDYAAKVRPETRKRILAIAEKIGYRRNSLAAATRTGQINTIAVILSFSKYQTIAPFSQVMTGIMLEASEHRQSVKIFSEDMLDDSFRQIVEKRISKVIMMSINSELRERAAELADQYSLNLVYAYEHGHGRFPAVNADNVETASNMVRYLAAHGHRRIGLLCVPHHSIYVEDRHNGYLKGMAECGLKTDPRWIRCSDDTLHSLEEIFALPAKQRPTALVALSDGIAAKVQSYAVRSGMDFPKDISVIGIGDTMVSSQLPYPLTTMRESLLETGKLLVRLLMKEPVGIRPDEFNVYHTHAELVERESVFNIKSNGRKK